MSITLSWILIAIGLVVTFLSKPIIDKKVEDENLRKKYIYIFKIIGMWIAVIGAIFIFIIGGSFGVRN